jgi:hypothetical protein
MGTISKPGGRSGRSVCRLLCSFTWCTSDSKFRAATFCHSSSLFKLSFRVSRRCMLSLRRLQNQNNLLGLQVRLATLQTQPRRLALLDLIDHHLHRAFLLRVRLDLPVHYHGPRFSSIHRGLLCLLFHPLEPQGGRRTPLSRCVS